MIFPFISFAPQTPTPEQLATKLVSQMTTAEKVSQLMMDEPAIGRLGVPKFHWWSEALHGIARNGVATVFPQAIGLAATWDPEHMEKVATAISIEARAKYNTTRNRGAIYNGITLWSPNINIFRDPRWGRGQETYGEDPFLTSRMGIAFVRGIQGDDPNFLRCVATPKHFAVHSGPEPLRHHFNAKTPERDLYETYFPAFEACVKEGKAASIMSAYSGFNGLTCTGSEWLLTDLLRKQWGFNGAVVSDVDSVSDLYTGHKVAKDAAEAAAMALKAGDDLNSGTTYRALPQALTRGLVTEADIDRAAVRLFTLRYRLGMFDQNTPFDHLGAADIDSPRHSQLNFETAKKSLVLLKNDGVLPLKKSVRRIAVIGPTADDQNTVIGNYAGTPSNPITILGGLRKRNVLVEYARGCELADGLNVGRTPFPTGSVTHDGQPGFKLEVFRGTAFEELLKTSSTGTIDFTGGREQPADFPLRQGFSARWSGTFTPPKSGTVTLSAAADDGMRLYVDDKLVIDDWNTGPERTKSVNVLVTKGKAVNLRFEYFQGTGFAVARLGCSMPGENPLLTEALQKAKNADVVVMALGITPSLEGEEMNVSAVGFAGGDRTSIEIPKPQQELLRAVKKLGKPIVVVLAGGSALSLDPSQANAILDEWYSGGRGGDAVASAIFGDFSPAGRLPVTFYRSAKDLPAFDDYAMAGRTYRYFGGRALFPFGHGLSYTSFRYGTPQATVNGANITLTVPVSNVGSYSGDEVVQVYAHSTRRQKGDAIRNLIGFARTSIGKGQTKQVTFTIPVARLRVWEEAEKGYQVRPGQYEIEVGASSQDIRSRAKVTIDGR